MKLTISRDLLLAAVSSVSSAAATKGDYPALTCIFMRAADGLRLDATNGDAYISRKVAVGVDAQGEVLVPAAALRDYLRNLPSAPVTMETDGNTLRLASGRSKAVINMGIPPDRFPLDDAPADDGLELDGAEVKAALQTACAFTSQTDRQHYSSAVSFRCAGGALSITALDGNTLFQQVIPGVDSQIEALVPAATLKEAIPALISDKLRVVCGRSLYFLFDGGFCRVPTLDKRFPSEPDINRMTVFNVHGKIRLGCEALRSMLQRVLSCCDKDFAPCTLEATDNELKATGKQMERGQVDDGAECASEGTAKIMLNLAIALPALAHFAKEADLILDLPEPRGGDLSKSVRITSPRLPGAAVVIVGMSND